MLKKLGSIIVILLVTTLGMWLYLANKFEKVVEKELLPMIMDNHSIVNADSNSIKISKYMFKVDLNNLVLLPNIKYLNIHSDKATIYYNPFGDKITICFDGEKLSMGSGNLAIYSPLAGHKITFNRSSLTNGFEDIKISFKEKDASLYFAADNNFISRANRGNIDFSSHLDGDVYTIDFSSSVDQMDINPEAKYLELLVKEILAENGTIDPSFNQFLDSFFSNINYKIFKETGPVDYKSKYSIKINKKHIANIIATLKDQKNILQLVENIKNDNYSVSLQETTGNAFNDLTSNIDLVGNEGKINFKLAASSAFDYTDEQKARIVQIVSNYLLDIMIKSYGIKPDIIKLADFEKSSQAFTNISKINFQIDFTTDIKTSKSEYSLILDLDDFNTSFSGDIDDKKLTSNITINTPKILIDGVTNFYNNMRPIFGKMVTGTQEDYKKLDEFMENFKNNGFAALSAFHSGAELKENETFVANIIFNPMGFEFKINDKSPVDFLTDERILNFLKATNPKSDNDKSDKIEDKATTEVTVKPQDQAADTKQAKEPEVTEEQLVEDAE